MRVEVNFQVSNFSRGFPERRTVARWNAALTLKLRSALRDRRTLTSKVNERLQFEDELFIISFSQRFSEHFTRARAR